MGKGARIKRLKEEQAKMLMAAKGIGPKLAPTHREMILAIIRAFELQHRTIVREAPILAAYISQAHHGALEKGFLAYHQDLMRGIEAFFDQNKFLDGEKIKKALIDFLNRPADDKSKSEDPNDGHRATREEIHTLEQSEDESSRNSSFEGGGGGPGIGD